MPAAGRPDTLLPVIMPARGKESTFCGLMRYLSSLTGQGRLLR